MSQPIIPEVYRKSPEVLVSYDTIEFESGVGIKTFYGAHTNEDGTGNYSLTSNSSSYSHSVFTNTTTLASSYDALVVSFDTSPFNKSAILAGTAQFIIPRAFSNSGANSSAWIYMELIKVDASSNATTLLSLSGSAVTIAGTQNYRMCSMKGTVPTTTVQVGEKVRWKIYLGQTAGGTIIFHSLGHDPIGRTQPGANSVTQPFGTDATTSVNGAVNTKLMALLPFVTDK